MISSPPGKLTSPVPVAIESPERSLTFESMLENTGTLVKSATPKLAMVEIDSYATINFPIKEKRPRLLEAVTKAVGFGKRKPVPKKHPEPLDSFEAVGNQDTMVNRYDYFTFEEFQVSESVETLISSNESIDLSFVNEYYDQVLLDSANIETQLQEIKLDLKLDAYCPPELHLPAPKRFDSGLFSPQEQDEILKCCGVAPDSQTKPLNESESSYRLSKDDENSSLNRDIDATSIFNFGSSELEMFKVEHGNLCEILEMEEHNKLSQILEMESVDDSPQDHWFDWQ